MIVGYFMYVFGIDEYDILIRVQLIGLYIKKYKIIIKLSEGINNKTYESSFLCDWLYKSIKHHDVSLWYIVHITYKLNIAFKNTVIN